MNALNYDPTWRETLQTQFMHNAFVAGILISIAAASIGYFTIVRNSTFGAHALAHIGLPGATGAVLLGFPVYAGMGIFAFAAALVIGFLGKKTSQREIATGTVLAFATGLGLLFSNMSKEASKQMQSILFGSIISVTNQQIKGFLIFDIILVAVLVLIYRPLLFSSLDEQIARSKGVPVNFIGIIFMVMLSGVITVSLPAVGTLLIFSLTVTPSAAAMCITKSPLSAIIVSFIFCMASIWPGLVLSTMYRLPASFATVALSTLYWALAKGYTAIRKRGNR